MGSLRRSRALWGVAATADGGGCGAQGCLLGGFLSYKVALLEQIWEATKPRFEKEKLLMAARPSLPDMGDEADEAEWSDRINQG